MREATEAKSQGRDVRHPGGGWLRRWLPTVLVLALLGAGVGAYRFDWGPRYLPWLVADPATEPEQVAPPEGLELPEWSTPAPLAAGLTASAAMRADRVEKALARPLRDKALGRHVVAEVAPLDANAPTWSRGDGRYLPASTTKLLTLGAALSRVGADHTFTTRVVRGAKPGEVVLVGGGDPYLASKALTPEEAATTYPVRADLTTLATQVAGALAGTGAGERRVRVRYDDSLFAGPSVNTAWPDDYLTDNVVSPITALMVDGGRESDGESRSEDPSRAAAQAFVTALRAAGVRVSGAPRPTTATAGAEELASVSSAPLGEIAERILDVSDNEGAEVMLRHVGLAAAGSGSFVDGAAGVLDTLAGLGIDVGGDELYDGSGLSRRNRIATQTVIDLLQYAAGPEGEPMRNLVSGLPVAGFTGSLSYRFAEVPAQARGLVRAKTGTLSGVHALAGIAVDRDDVPLVFVIAADKVALPDTLAARDALDRAVAALATCRCS